MYYNKFNSYNMKIKNDLSQEDFIKLCIVVANKHANAAKPTFNKVGRFRD